MNIEESVLPEGPSLDEYIAMLQKLREQHGGALRVQKWMPSTGRAGAPDPRLAFKRTYNTKRLGDVKAPQFFNAQTDNPVQKGEPVIRV